MNDGDGSMDVCLYASQNIDMWWGTNCSIKVATYYASTQYFITNLSYTTSKQHFLERTQKNKLKFFAEKYIFARPVLPILSRVRQNQDDYAYSSISYLLRQQWFQIKLKPLKPISYLFNYPALSCPKKEHTAIFKLRPNGKVIIYVEQIYMNKYRNSIISLK